MGRAARCHACGQRLNDSVAQLVRSLVRDWAEPFTIAEAVAAVRAAGVSAAHTTVLLALLRDKAVKRVGRGRYRYAGESA